MCLFAWQMLHDALPSSVFLLRRHVDVSDMCQRCCLVAKTVIHCIRDCPKLQPIWRNIGFVLPADFFVHHSFPDLLKSFDGFAMVVVLATAWVIWKSRYRFVIARTPQPVHIVREARALWILVAHAYHRDIPPTIDRWVRWKPHRLGFVALNTDGSSVGDPGPTEFGGVVRCGDGNLNIWICWTH